MRRGLTPLPAAVFTALTDEGRPSVVVVDSSADRIAHWFAAVSYPLPPPPARQLSFATHLFRPTRSRLHLIGTVPEAQDDFGADDEASYAVFGFIEGAFPPIVLTHPLVHLLVHVGVGSIRPVWTWTRDYTHGRERDPGDWHAPVATAAAEGGIALDGLDIEALIDWLGDAHHLGPLRAEVARSIDETHRALDDSQLAKLSAAALAGGAPDLHQKLEGRLHGSRMRAYMTGVEDAVQPVPITDTEQRAHATAHWRRLLAEAETARQRVRLPWGGGARWDPPEPLLTEQTAQPARELLGSMSTSAGSTVEQQQFRTPEPRPKSSRTVTDPAHHAPGTGDRVWTGFSRSVVVMDRTVEA
ncbi:GTPase-associated protein 1-related protein [Streptomyces sp. NPDC050564]|uniref:GTPase-associated protein 1-related protein n=1 Tax=Streptomyces sp. NPDC050564 TaxID=3365631 RepID=UPI0037AEB83B